jgi:hypothetical protein
MISKYVSIIPNDAKSSTDGESDKALSLSDSREILMSSAEVEPQVAVKRMRSLRVENAAGVKDILNNFDGKKEVLTSNDYLLPSIFMDLYWAATRETNEQDRASKQEQLKETLKKWLVNDSEPNQTRLSLLLISLTHDFKQVQHNGNDLSTALGGVFENLDGQVLKGVLNDSKDKLINLLFPQNFERFNSEDIASRMYAAAKVGIPKRTIMQIINSMQTKIDEVVSHYHEIFNLPVGLNSEGKAVEDKNISRGDRCLVIPKIKLRPEDLEIEGLKLVKRLLNPLLSDSAKKQYLTELRDVTDCSHSCSEKIHKILQQTEKTKQALGGVAIGLTVALLVIGSSFLPLLIPALIAIAVIAAVTAPIVRTQELQQDRLASLSSNPSSLFRTRNESNKENFHEAEEKSPSTSRRI